MKIINFIGFLILAFTLVIIIIETVFLIIHDIKNKEVYNDEIHTKQHFAGLIGMKFIIIINIIVMIYFTRIHEVTDILSLWGISTLNSFVYIYITNHFKQERKDKVEYFKFKDLFKF